MKVVIKYISQIFQKDTSKPKKDTTKKYAREVINKYEKTLKRLSYE